MSTDPSPSGGDETIDQMMKRLGIVEDDLDDVVYEEEGPLPAEATRWLAIARVFTDSEYSSFWFFKNMRSAWDLAQQVETRSLDSNLHTFQFKCLGDWERVMEGGPWNFRGHEYKDHGDGLHPPQALVFKDLRASWSMSQGNRPGRGRGSRDAGRTGAGRGRGGRMSSSQVVLHEDSVGEEIMDEDDKLGSRKRAGMASANPPMGALSSGETGGTLVTVGKGGQVGSLVNQFEPLAPPSPNPLYTSEGVQGMDQVLQHVPRKVTPAMNAILLAPYEAKEVKEALLQMFPLKAPGPDGYPAFFFQKHWDICGPDVTRAVLSIVQGNESAEIINDTILVLIPKRNNSKNNPYCALKLDMMKAYDRVEWEYLETIMLKLGFSQQWTSVIMGMVNSVSLSVLFNGNKLEEFKPTRASSAAIISSSPPTTTSSAPPPAPSAVATTAGSPVVATTAGSAAPVPVIYMPEQMSGVINDLVTAVQGIRLFLIGSQGPPTPPQPAIFSVPAPAPWVPPFTGVPQQPPPAPAQP
ncbi:hypothetical protein QYE76_026469 [Lolium multiflorum]|uniref:Reverse transcriptase domain-containing protein n=1 Tax=Lolium multiflorum TaxID=4521 RepID=A0AAD8RIN1_LOLMU|nr:hypothetical protein QYE76_026469 [Lolium multiflorum]